MSRGLIPTLLFALSAVVFFGLGSLLAARHAASNDNEQIAQLRAEVGALKRQGGGHGGHQRADRSASRRRWTIAAAPLSWPTSSSS